MAVKGHPTRRPIMSRRRIRMVYLGVVLIVIVAVFQLDHDAAGGVSSLYLGQHHFDTASVDSLKPHYGPMISDPTKPFFVLHVGPPKTATTTIQLELTNFREILKKDNYFFLGTDVYDGSDLLIQTLLDRDCMLEVNRHRTRRLPQQDAPKCWQSFQTRLQQFRMEGKNLIISEEWFSIQFVEFAEVGRTSVDWVALREVLRDWNVIVVVGYRRLYDILPSAKQQWDRWFPHIKALNEWPPQGRVLEPLFPNVLKDPHLADDYIPQKIMLQGVKQWSYTDYLIKSIGPYFPIKIMDFHRGNIRTSFLCEMLEGAWNSCSTSRQMDESGEESKANQEQSLYYDVLVTKAAEIGWIDTATYHRRDMVVRLLTYYEQTLGRTTNELEVICPPDDQLDYILERSLAKEKKLMPHLSEDDHRDGFALAKRNKKFCWIDAEKVLMRPEIRHFFLSLQ